MRQLEKVTLGVQSQIRAAGTARRSTGPLLDKGRISLVLLLFRPLTAQTREGANLLSGVHFGSPKPQAPQPHYLIEALSKPCGRGEEERRQRLLSPSLREEKWKWASYGPLGSFSA